MEHGGIIVYDIVSIPDELAIDVMYRIMEKTSLLFYDSSSKGNKPYYMVKTKNKKGVPQKPKIFVDVTTKKGKEMYDKIMKELENEQNK